MDPQSVEEVEIEVEEAEQEEEGPALQEEAEQEVEADEDDKSLKAKTKKRIDQLLADRKTERAEKEFYRQELDKAKKALEELQTKSVSTEGVALDKYELGLKAHIKSLNEQIIKAQEEGNHAKFAELNDQLLDAKVEMRDVALRKERKVEPKKEVEEAPKQPTREEIERSLSPQAKAWVNDNPWFDPWGDKDGDEVRTAAAVAVNNQLIREGYNPRNEDFYEQLDERLKEKFPHLYEKPNKKSPVASPSRTAPGGKAKVKLSKREVELAIRTLAPLYNGDKDKAIKAWAEQKARLESMKGES